MSFVEKAKYMSFERIINKRKWEEKMEETIDLREYFFILKKKIWLIVASALVCGLISGLVSFFVLSPV